MRWSLLWNHWFWVTLLIIGGVKESCGESLAVEAAQDGTAADGVVALPAGARGGRLVPIPAANQPASNVQVSQSVSVSKVSVKMGGISSSGIQQKQLHHQMLSEISDIYEDETVSNSLAREPQPRPEYRRLDVLGPLSQPLNSLGYDDHFKMRPTEKPQSFLESIISKLKSLALITTANVRVSAGLSPPANITVTSTVAPAAEEVETMAVTEAGSLGEDYAAYADYYYGTYPPDYYEEPAATDLPQSEEVVHQAQPTFAPRVAVEEEASQRLEALPEVEISNSLMKDEQSEDPRDSSKERSIYARGRSLPLELLDQLPRLPPLLPENPQSAATAERVQPLEILVLEEHPLATNQEQEKEEEEEEEIETIALLEELGPASRIPVSGGETDIRITYDDGDNVVGISSIVGMVLGIIIFVIIAAVVLLLAVCRGRNKQKKVQDDVISQSSYMSNMTYATTISEHSVNYGPAWEKEVCPEDLCSLDNDSFLNSLEAVTAEYWVDPANKGTHKL